MRSCYAPFTDVVFRRQGEGFAVDVWGRTYRYEKSLFPVSISTAGREILAVPMKLHLRFGEKEGVFRKWEYTFSRNDGESAEVFVSAHCENVILNALLHFEMDGLIRTDFRIVPYWSFAPNGENIPRLTGAWLDLAVQKESSYLFHYWPNDVTSIIPRQDVVNSGETASVSFPFKPYIWCGWEEGGIGICCESNEGIELSDMEQCILVEKREKETAIRWNLLDRAPSLWDGRADEWCDALAPLCWSFGVQATPVRPQPKDRAFYYRGYHIFDVRGTGAGAEERLDTVPGYGNLDPTVSVLAGGDLPQYLGEAGVRYVVLHANWSLIENFGLVADPEAMKRAVRRFHEAGVRVLVYYGYEYSTLMPDWNRRAGEYLIKNARGHYTGGWQAENLRAYMCCYNSGFARELEDNILSCVDEYGFDGIYTDGTYVPWECANESHGCGWRDREGMLHPTFPIWAVRDLVKHLYGEIHARGGVIQTHQSTCCLMPTLSFCDFCYDGENIQNALKRDLGFLSTAAFRCEYSGYSTGMMMTFIAYTSNDMTIQDLSAITLPHNVFPIPGKLRDLAWLSQLWQIWEERNLDGAEFYPYWKDGGPVTVSGLTAAQYRVGEEITLAAANLTPETAETSLTISGAKRAVNLLDGTELPYADGAFHLRARPYTPYIIAISM